MEGSDRLDTITNTPFHLGSSLVRLYAGNAGKKLQTAKITVVLAAIDQASHNVTVRVAQDRGVGQRTEERPTDLEDAIVQGTVPDPRMMATRDTENRMIRIQILQMAKEIAFATRSVEAVMPARHETRGDCHCRHVGKASFMTMTRGIGGLRAILEIWTKRNTSMKFLDGKIGISSFRCETGTDSGSRRAHSRASSRGRRTIQRQYSNVYVESPRTAEHHFERYEYIAGPPISPHQLRYPPQQGPPLPGVRAMSRPVHQRAPYHPDRHHSEESYEGDGEDGYKPARSGSTRRGRLRSREANLDRGGMMALPKAGILRHPAQESDEETVVTSHDRRGRRLGYAPSPPPARSSSMGYLTEPEMDERERHQPLYGHSQRRRSRSRPHPVEARGLSNLRAGDALTVVERHVPRPAQDYDWYDNEGIRVRVREI